MCGSYMWHLYPLVLYLAIPYQALMMDLPVDVPETGTIVNGIGNEIVILLGVLIGMMVLVMFLKTFLAGSSPQHLHPDTVSAVQSARRVMGVAREGAEPQVPVETCSVCLDRAQHPVQTNCGHRFCARCMLEYWRHDQWPHPARCPICRTTVRPGPIGFLLLDQAHGGTRNHLCIVNLLKNSLSNRKSIRSRVVYFASVYSPGHPFAGV